ncbi:hypothetical protein M8C21_002524, partial [Ambrosia artemisiifolia]
MSSSEGSPHRKDVESGGGDEEYDSVNDPFSTTVDRLKRWKVDYLFPAAGEKPNGIPKAPPSPIHTGDHDVKGLVEKLQTNPYKGIHEDDSNILDRKNVFGSNTYPRKKGRSFSVKGLAKKLKTNPDKGIHEDDSNIFDRKNVFGSNTYPRKKGQSFWRFLLDACRNTALIILMVAAAASLALGIKTEGIKEGWYDGGSIALAVLVVVVVTAISDYKQSLQFENLAQEKHDIQLEVVRGGRRVKISIFDIVVGDVIPLKTGDQVPADGVFISGHSLAIDESSMTGESKLVTKDHKSPFLMSGCKVADGYGTMLATSVGINTEWGLIMAWISEDNGEETPLQVRLNGVVTFIGIVGLVVAVYVLVILLSRFFTGHTKDEEGKVEFIAGKTSPGDAVNGAIKIIAVAVCLCMLAYSMRKMMADKALIRLPWLSAFETMGSATTICSDKTGTLTLNVMTVVEAYICGRKIDPPNNTSELSSGVASLLIESVAHNTTGSVFVPEDGKDVEVFGSPTEKAILQWGLGMNFEAVRSESSVIHAFPFNSERKRGGVAVK